MTDISNLASTFTSCLQPNGYSPLFYTGTLQSAMFVKRLNPKQD